MTVAKLFTEPWETPWPGAIVAKGFLFVAGISTVCPIGGAAGAARELAPDTVPKGLVFAAGAGAAIVAKGFLFAVLMTTVCEAGGAAEAAVGPAPPNTTADGNAGCADMGERRCSPYNHLV